MNVPIGIETSGMDLTIEALTSNTPTGDSKMPVNAMSHDDVRHGNLNLQANLYRPTGSSMQQNSNNHKGECQ
jgi:hypothetical protein